MRRLPLYPEGPPRLAVERAAVLQPNSGCRRCELAPRSDNEVRARGLPCIGPNGRPGGVLVLAGSPSAQGGLSRRVLDSQDAVGAFLRELVARTLPPDKPVLYDAAVRCAPGTRAVGDEHVAACRGYLAHVLAQAKPERVLVLGDAALKAVLGEDAPSAWDTRRGYAYLGDAGLPVFILDDPQVAIMNRFARADFERSFRWALTTSPPPAPPWDGAAHEVRTATDAHEAVRVLRRAPWCAWDTETFGRQYDRAFRVLCVSLCAAGSDDAYVWDERALADPQVRTPLLELLVDPDVEKAAQNGPYDVATVHAAWGVTVRGVGRDTQYRRALIDPEALKALEVQQALVGMHGGKAESVAELTTAQAGLRRALERARSGQTALFGGASDLPKGLDLDDVQANPKRYAYAYLKRDTLLRRNALDTVSTARLESLHGATIARTPDLARAWEVMHGATEAFSQMTAWGVRVNREQMSALASFLRMDAERYRTRLAKYGLTNPGSADDVAALLYDRLKLPVKQRTAGGKPSTDREALDDLSGMHPAVDDIAEWRRLDKLRGTYAEGLARHVADDGLIHVDFRPDGARSGRPSAGGGLHGLPRASSPEGKMVRDILVPWEGEELIELDVSQEELRVLAGLSGDAVMSDVFVQGGDLHQRAAELIAPQVWKIDGSRVTSKHREVAKTINLSLVYGKGDAALGKTLGLPTDKAAEVKQAILGRFSRADAWMGEQLAFTRANGYARTFIDGEPAMRRPLWGVAQQGEDDYARKVRGHDERAARNTPVQGTSAHIIIRWLVEMVRWVLEEGVRARIGLSVHDSLLASVHPNDRRRFIEKGCAVIADVRVGRVPLVADVKVGPAAGSLVKFKL